MRSGDARHIDGLGRSVRKNYSIVNLIREDEKSKREKGQENRKNARPCSRILKCDCDREKERRAERIRKIKV